MPHLVAKKVALAVRQAFEKTGKSRKSAHIVLVFHSAGLLPEGIGIQRKQMIEQSSVVSLALPLQGLGSDLVAELGPDMREIDTGDDKRFCVMVFQNVF